jgi:hypothetical protein
MKDQWCVRLCRLLALCALSASIFLSAGQLLAQVDTGTILGTVKDSSGAVVPDAQVTLTNTETGFSQTTKTSGVGSYIFTPIKIGTYTVQATKAGFEKAVQLNAKVDVEQRLVVDLNLVPGQVTQTVEVTAAPPALQTESAMVGQVVGQGAVNDLPLNGRNFTFLAQTVAGVHMSGFWSGGFGAAGSFSANGTRPEQNNYLLDGMDNNTNQLDFLAGTNYVNLPPPDAIGEFKVQTADYSADVGKAGGAVLNGTIKSGTNQFHGDIWEFLRNDKLDAAQFFENSGGIKKGEYRLNQFGGTIGGPVVIPHVYNGHNKTFFFADYQGTRLRQGQTHTNSVPTALEVSSGFQNLSDIISGQTNAGCLQDGTCTRTDDLGRVFPDGTVFDPATTRAVTKGAVDPITGLTASSSGFVRDPFYAPSLTGVTNFTTAAMIAKLNQLPSGRLDSNAIKLLQLYPAAMKSGIFNNETVNPPLIDTVDQSDIRMDHNFGDRDQMFGRVSFSINPMYNPPPFTGYADDGALAINGGGHQWNPTLNTVLSETHSFSPTIVNEIRVGVTRQSTTALQAYADQMGIPAQFGIQGIPQMDRNGGLPSLGIGGLTQIGSTAWFPSEEPNQTDQLTENVTFLKGGHTFKGGVEIQHIKWAVLQPSWSRGQFNFGGSYTEIPGNGTGTTGMAQMLLSAEAPTVEGGVQSGGADGVFASNIFNRDFTHNYYGGYFQDDWKVNSKLTLNLGLRYEYFDMGVDDNDQEAAFQFHSFAPNGGGVYKIASKYYNANLLAPAFLAVLKEDNFGSPQSVKLNGFIDVPKTDFAPRLGFAYRVSNKLVMRGGYGLSYGPPEQPLDHETETYPFDNTLSWFGDNVHSITYGGGNLATLENGMLYTPVYNTVSFDANQVGGLPPNGDDPHFKPTYTESYNLTFQYQLTPNNTLSIGYVGNQAHDLTVQPNVNSTTAVLPPSYDASPGNPGAQYRPMPDLVNNSLTYSEGNSFYHSAQVTFERRLSHGLYFNANYTFSELFTDGQSINNGSSPYRAPVIPGLGIQYDYSRSQYDIPQLFHFSGGYELPMGKGHSFLGNSSGVVNQLVSGWKTNFILTLQDGYAFNVASCPTQTHASNDGLNCNSLLVPGQNVDAGPHNVNQWINPNAFAAPAPATAIGQNAALGGMGMQARGPGFHRLDFSVFKDFRTSEKTRLEFRAEAFNLTNTPQFANPSNTSIGSIYFGQITGLVDGNNDPREIQFALKFYF